MVGLWWGCGGAVVRGAWVCGRMHKRKKTEQRDYLTRVGAGPSRIFRVCAAAQCSRTPTRRSHEPGGPNWLYNCAQMCPRAEAGPRRRHVISTDSANPRHPYARHSAPECECIRCAGDPHGVRQQLVCRLHERWMLDPPIIHPARVGRARSDRVTVDDHIDTQAGQRGGYWCCGQREQWCLLLPAR